MKIGVFDSGIGGLTVLKSLIKYCPNHEYIYFGDTINLPYGEKTKEEIVSFASKIIKFFEEEKVDLIVIACGTASSHKDYLKSKIRIIDIISPIKGKLDNYKKVSIIATQLSVKKNEFGKYINTDVNLIACPKIVPMIENNDYSGLDDALKEYLAKAKDSDALLLGCTHYPIIKDQIKKYFDKDIICLDDYIVDYIKKEKEGRPGLKLYFSKVTDTLEENVKRVLGNDNIKIERKCLND